MTRRRSCAALLMMTAVSVFAAGVAHAEPDGPLLSSARREVAQAVAASGTGRQGAAPTRTWLARQPVLAGALAGTAAGLALSRVDAIGGANHDPRVAFIGTGVGAWGGLIASAVQQSRRGPVRRGTKIGIAAGAVALVVVPVLACYGAGGCGGVS